MPILAFGKKAPFTSTSLDDTVFSFIHPCKILDLIGKSELKRDSVGSYELTDLVGREPDAIAFGSVDLCPTVAQKIPLNSFNYHRDTLAATYACRRQTITSTPTMQFLQHGQN